MLPRPVGDGLAMQQLHFAAEVRQIGELETVEVREAGLKLARQLIEQQASPAFDPGAYTDEVRARLEAAIEKKVAGQEITVAEPRPPAGGKVIDLMETLRASLQSNASARDETARLRERKPPKRAAKKTARSRRTTRG